MTDPAPTKNTGTRGSLGISLARKAAIAFAIISAYVILAPVYLIPSRGSANPCESVMANVTVHVLCESAHLPELYLTMVEVREDGAEQTAARLRLQHSEPLEPTGEQSTQYEEAFHFRVRLYLNRARRKPDEVLTDRVADLMHRRLAYARLWHPERYRLQVTSPLNIKSEPSYYRVSELDFWGEYDFAVTVLEDTEQ